MKKNVISKTELSKANKIITAIKSNYEKYIIGQDELKRSILISLMTNGHLLIESLPGLAKTTAAKITAQSVNATFNRIQCTPDLLPSDIIGTQIFNYSSNEFETRLGPIFANVVLLDEINRANSKTQSATLEAMQEQQITIDIKSYSLPNIFIVIATENPVEQEGTYKLSEAQVDRFIIKEKLNYPTKNEEHQILNNIESKVYDNNKSIVSLSDIEYIQQLTEKVYMDDEIKKYIVEIINATRHPQSYFNNELEKYIEYGASPRASIAFMKGAKANAIINGRNYVIPDDIKELRYKILRHRLSLSYYAIDDDISPEKIIDAIFEKIPTP